MLCPLYLLQFFLLFSFTLLLLFHFILAVPMRRCMERHLCMSSVFPIKALGVNCFSAGQSVIVFAEASTVKIKLYNYYYCNYVIVVYFSNVIFFSISITVGNAPWRIKVVLRNVFVFYHVSLKGDDFFLGVEVHFVFLLVEFYCTFFPSIIKY